MQTDVFQYQAEQIPESNDLDSIIKEAMTKTKVLKEIDLAHYIPHGEVHLAHEFFINLKRIDKETLAALIKENILDRDPKKFPSQEIKKSTEIEGISDNLERTIEKAMDKVNAQKETDICSYISYYNGKLHPFTYENLKRNNPKKLLAMITKHVLSKEPKIQDKKPVSSQQDDQNSLESIITKALKKKGLKLKKEEDVCRYIPKGKGYLHPLAFRSLKRKNPEMLKEMIQQYVLDPGKPKAISWKRKGDFSSQNQLGKHAESKETEPSKIDQLLQKTSESIEILNQLIEHLKNQTSSKIAPNAQELSKLTESTYIAPNTYPQNLPEPIRDRYLRTIQNQLIKQIRQKQADHELWGLFVELVEWTENQVR